MQTETLQALADALAAIAVTILLPALIGLLRALAAKLQAEILAKKPDFQFDLGRAVDIAISAAQQMFLKHGLSKEDRLNYAINIVEKLLTKGGHDTDIETIVAAIEAKILQKKEAEATNSELGTWRYGERATCECQECRPIGEKE